jgi:hypothetical protein
MNHARESSRILAGLLRSEHGAMADFLVALAEFDRQRLWLRLGHSSLFYFLHRELGLSKGPRTSARSRPSSSSSSPRWSSRFETVDFASRASSSWPG